MKRLLAALVVVTAAGCASEGGPQPMAKGYWVKGHEFEGCECESVCPCIFSRDTSYGDCRGFMVMQFTEGSCNGTDMAGVTFAAVLTKSGKNMEKEFGKWIGVLYVSEKASEAQKAAVGEIMKGEFGPAFGKLDVKFAPITITRNGDEHVLKLGAVGDLKIKGIKTKDGHVTCVENPPSPLAFPKMFCCLAEVNHFDDGTSKWEFKGRNAFYCDFEMKSKQ